MQRRLPLPLEVRYSDDLCLCIKDNGIGISSFRNNGTEVMLQVPGERAYVREYQPPIGLVKVALRR